MIPNIQLRPQVQTELRTALSQVPVLVDLAAVVRVVETAFDPKDPATYPVVSTHFATKTASGVATLVFDLASGKYLLVFPDPTGGWTFVAATITDPVTVQGYVVTVDGYDIGANTIPAKTVTANGQELTLPYLCIEIPTTVIADVAIPASI